MRYIKNRIFENAGEAYRRYLKKRGIKKIIQHDTTKFRHPELKDLANFDRINYIWKTGDRYYKLADKYYGSAEDWWIIAWFNKKPTENHIKVGDVVLVPRSLTEIVNIIGL